MPRTHSCQDQVQRPLGSLFVCLFVCLFVWRDSLCLVVVVLEPFLPAVCLSYKHVCVLTCVHGRYLEQWCSVWSNDECLVVARNKIQTMSWYLRVVPPSYPRPRSVTDLSATNRSATQSRMRWMDHRRARRKRFFGTVDGSSYVVGLAATPDHSDTIHPVVWFGRGLDR